MFKFNPYCFVSLVLLSIITACSEQSSSQQQKHAFQGATMGTRYHITVIANTDAFHADSVKKHVDELLQGINRKMSTYIPESEISRFNRFNKTEWFPVSKPFAEVVSASQEIAQLTNGRFDITAGNLVNLWGFGPDHQFEIPKHLQISTVLQITGYQLLDVRLNPPALRKSKPKLKIDLSAIAKGYAVDKVGELLLNHGYQNYLVEIGGEVISHGVNVTKTPWRIAIENPSTKNRSYKHTLHLNNQSVATSGDYRNYFEKSGQRYSHTIDPFTGKPIIHQLASVTVIGQSAMRVDALATALMVMGETSGKAFIKESNLEAFMIIRNQDNSFSTWDNLKTNNKH